MVFQNHSLLPWLTCFDNVALAVDQVFRRTMSKARAQGVGSNTTWIGCKWATRCTSVRGRSPAA
ncbi:Bicarbonate transport ATP-binding protein CmpC [Raoultella planticola]|uniref:Bicarbonate transport ATP-binding protein CmpC n=1 Tax=Raoultella planticola TaxID=575 RepID=A0A485ARS9_RAOPL|nr:Bicarbonate transport ATP-binding protein CmpC [Raoultella planticola]